MRLNGQLEVRPKPTGSGLMELRKERNDRRAAGSHNLMIRTLTVNVGACEARRNRIVGTFSQSRPLIRCDLVNVMARFHPRLLFTVLGLETLHA